MILSPEDPYITLPQKIENESLIIEEFKRNWEVKSWMNGFFKEEDLLYINIHWLQFTPPNESSFITMAVLYVIIMSVGVFGNFLVVFMFYRCESLRTPGNRLVVNLAVSDAFMLLKTPVFIYNCFYHGPMLGDLSCRLYAFLGGLTGTASIGTLAAISYDRYFVIKYPLKIFSGNRITFCLIFSWIYAFCFSVIPLLNIGLGKYQYEGYLTSCSFDYLTDNKATKVFIVAFFSAAFVVPVTIIIFSYVKISQVVVGRTSAVSVKGDSCKHIEEEAKRKQEIKLAVTVLVVIVLWVLSWAPYATVALLGLFGQKHLITPFSSMVPALFCKAASAIDPYVYAISHPKFKEELWKMLHPSANKQTRSNNKIWTTDTKLISTMSFESRDYTDTDVEEEVIEVELQVVDLRETSNRGKVGNDNMTVEERKMKRQSSKASLLCLNPTFSNKSSNFRRLSRRFSSFSRSHSKECEEDDPPK